MTAETIAKYLNTRQKGQFYTVKMKRLAKTRKGTTELIEKESIMQGLLCDYTNRAPVKNAVNEGLRAEPELPSHIEKSFNIGNVRFWQGKNGKTYLALCATGNEPKVQWYCGGEPCKKSDVAEYLLASETAKKPTKEETEEKGQAQFFGIDVANILEVS